MPWFTAKCAFLSVHFEADPPHEQIGEFRYSLVRAEDESAARGAVSGLAKKREHTYENVYGATVHWKFDRIQEIKELFADELASGMEVYFEYFSPSESSR
jgi:hypothetical protein